MAEKGFKRKLTAILSADVEGYSRLMGEDEEATVRTITAYREVLTTLIQQHNGKVLDSPGDNLLAEFVSVVDAVQCAVAVQKEIKARNDQLPENRRMQFRIGINLGDVIQEEERIYGDGVNIAARLEGLSEPGGICISKTAFDHIESKLPYGYEFLGDQTVKNIAKPVGAYRVMMEPRVTVAEEKEAAEVIPFLRRKAAIAGAVAVLVVIIGVAVWNFYLRPPPIEPASVERMAYPLPDKPSVAVLPFVNMSGDPEQEYFSDGLTEEIISALSKIPRLFVIARNSTFKYKEKAVEVQQVSEELGVRYVLEGSVRKAGDRVRITAKLIDAINGHHLWSERYDRDFKDLFALQDEITTRVITALDIKLTEGEGARRFIRGTDNLEAYLKVLQAREHAYRGTKEDYALCRMLLEEAIAMDPNYAVAYAGLGFMHFTDLMLGSSKSREVSYAKAIELAEKSLSLDDNYQGGRAVLCSIYSIKGQHDKAIAEGERAVALDPNFALGYKALAGALNNAGRPEEAIRMVNRAIRLNPLPPPSYFYTLGDACRLAKRYGEAIRVYKKAIDASPNSLFPHLGLAATYNESGRQEEAMSEAAEVLRIAPKFSLGQFAKTLPYKNQADKDSFIEALRRAGLK